MHITQIYYPTGRGGTIPLWVFIGEVNGRQYNSLFIYPGKHLGANLTILFILNKGYLYLDRGNGRKSKLIYNLHPAATPLSMFDIIIGSYRGQSGRLPSPQHPHRANPSESPRACRCHFSFDYLSITNAKPEPKWQPEICSLMPVVFPEKLNYFPPFHSRVSVDILFQSNKQGGSAHKDCISVWLVQQS